MLLVQLPVLLPVLRSEVLRYWAEPIENQGGLDMRLGSTLPVRVTQDPNLASINLKLDRLDIPALQLMCGQLDIQTTTKWKKPALVKLLSGLPVDRLMEVWPSEKLVTKTDAQAYKQRHGQGRCRQEEVHACKWRKGNWQGQGQGRCR